MNFSDLFQLMANVQKQEPTFTFGNGRPAMPMSRAVIVCSESTIKTAHLTWDDIVVLPLGVSLVLSDEVPYGQVYILDRKYVASFEPLAVTARDALRTMLLTPEKNTLP